MSITSPLSTPSPSTRASNDLALFHAWKQSGDKKDLSKLIGALAPVIYTEVSRQSGTLPPAALAGQATKWAIKAIHSYDPDRGVALATHVTGYLRKIRRLNYTYQNAVRLPENLQLKFTEYQNQVSRLEELLGREPTDDEVAKALGWTKAQTIRLRSGLYRELSESGSEKPTEVSRTNTQSFVLQHIKDNLTPEEAFLLENADKPSAFLKEKLGVNQARISYLKTKLTKKVQGLKDHAEGVFL